jgi:hypothetical protein
MRTLTGPWLVMLAATFMLTPRAASAAGTIPPVASKGLSAPADVAGHVRVGSISSTSTLEAPRARAIRIQSSGYVDVPGRSGPQPVTRTLMCPDRLALILSFRPPGSLADMPMRYRAQPGAAASRDRGPPTLPRS